MKKSTHKIVTEKGLKLFCRRWEGKRQLPVLLFVHGMGDHSGRYRHPMTYFNERGYACYAYDQRGHGASEGPRAYAERFARLLGDLDKVIAWISQKEQRPIFLVGHSFGGQVALNYAAGQHRQLAGLILSSPNIALALPVNPIKKHLGVWLSAAMPTFLLDAGLKPELISHDPDEVRAYAEDPLVNKKISLRLASEMFSNLDRIMQLAAEVTLPVLLMHSGDDKICSPQGTEAFYQACGSVDKTFKLYLGFYHELFNEIDREIVFADMLEWIEEHQ